MQKFNHDSNPQFTEALESAIEFQDAGRYPEAEEFYLAILRDEPLHPLANHNMGQLVLHGKYPASSLSYFLAALESDPANCRYWAAYIGALIRLGSMSLAGEALSLARQQGLQGSELDAVAVRLEGAGALPVVAVSPDVLQACQEPDAESINELMRLFAQAEYAETVTLAKSMTEHCSLHGFGWKMLGAAYLQLGYVQDALQALQKAATFLPNDADLYSNLGLAFRASGRTGEAYASCQRSLQLRSDFAEGHNNLGILLHDLGRFDDACASYARAIRLKPDFAEAHNNLGNSTRELGRLVEAEASYRQALRFKPDYAEAYSNLALTLRESGRLNEAQACLMLALQIRPDYAEAYCNLAGVLMESCQLNAAAENLRRALLIRPDSATLHSNLIFTLDMMTDMDITALQQERRAWNAMHAAHLLQRRPFATIPDPERRLRIGYVSADFRMHSAAFAFGAMLENFDHAKFEVLAYSNSVREDELTRELKKNVSVWRNIVGLSDDAVANMIREDKVDILVDLSGHSAGNRLLVFARKPAPIQITAWGYATGTGMDAMDVFFADPVFVPPEEKCLYAEQVVYLPCALGAWRSAAAPAVNALPALSGKGVTFGSFNRLVKNSEDSYRAWAKVLQACSDSRMVIKTPALDDAGTRAQVMACFAREGIAVDRIVLQGRTSRDAHLAAFNHVDIALDPFPLGGGVTAMEGLMMGVPLVTLRWPTIAGRVSASIVTSVGLPDWIAQTQEQYVALAIEKARDLPSLCTLRGQLRSRFASSILGDQPTYVRVVEREYRRLWRDWCAGNFA